MLPSPLRNNLPRLSAGYLCLLLWLSGCDSDRGFVPIGTADGSADVADVADVAEAAMPDGSRDSGATDAMADVYIELDTRAGNADDGGTDAGGDAAAPPLCEPVGGCSPFVRTTCGAGQICRVGAAGAACVAAPPAPLSEDTLCEGSHQCGSGLVCMSLNGQAARCHKLCPANQVGFCGDGKACTTSVFGDSCLKLCTTARPACDIYSSQSCTEPNSKCDLAVHPETKVRYTACSPAGVGQIDASCMDGGDCAAGLICIGSAGEQARCRQVCDQQNAAAVCTRPDQKCAGRSRLFGITFCS